jgi:hypothetical protein
MGKCIVLRIVVIPDTFNEDVIVVLFKAAKPDIFNDDNIVVILFNVVYPDTFNVPYIVVLFAKVVKPETSKDDTIVVLFTNLVNPEILKVPYTVVLLANVVNPDTFNIPFIVVSFPNKVFPITCNMLDGFFVPIPTFPYVFIVILSKTIIPVDEIVCVKSPVSKCEDIIEVPVPAHILGIVPLCFKKPRRP